MEHRSETNKKMWGLIAILLAVLVVCVVGSRMLINSPPSEQLEVITTSEDLSGNNAALAQDELLLRLNQLENKLDKKPSQKKSVGNGSETEKDIKVLQQQIDILAKQVSELTKVISQSDTKTAVQKYNEDIQLFKTAANDPAMRQKYNQFRDDFAQKQQTLIKETFREEVVDEQWAIESEDVIKTDFYKNQSLTGYGLESLDCRTSICQVSVTVPKFEINNSDDAAEQFVRENELLASLTRDLSRAKVISKPDGKGGEKYEIFLFREGYKIPKIQDPLEGKSMSEMIEYIERY